MAEKQAVFCPNCGGKASGAAGERIVCTTCNAVFRFRAGEAKLEKTIDLERLQADVEDLKQRLPASTPAADPPADPDPEDDDMDDDDQEDL